ncbi:MAG: cysteine--tRNA ligase [Candidatus Desulforudis sp.]|nr:cysteine--tRNA ligase [Desulforudis sp.]
MEIFNTLTGRKETFRPREPGKVGIYVCGPTTYNFIHLGNARALVVFDTIRRYFLYRGYQVSYVQNFTDVDDKIINRARAEGMDPAVLAARYVDEYFVDADALNVRRADVHPKASNHIPEIIELIQTLVDRELAYEAGGDVYFAVRKFTDYGKLSKRSVDDLRAGARVEVGEQKHDPLDFALWKAAKPGEPRWDSPWGPGRPGWHIECSAMAQKYLGVGFDIHGGGADLIFPHHENEIAQSEGATGRPFARYWVHNGFVTIREEKMSKSLGNVSLMRELTRIHPGAALRLFLLSNHYRSPLDFNQESMDAGVRSLERLKTSINLVREALESRRVRENTPDDAGGLAAALDQLRTRFEAAMDDDFNTALAQAVLFDLAGEVNGYLHHSERPNRGVLQKVLDLFTVFNNVLGIFPEREGWLVLEAESLGGELSHRLLDLLIAVRQDARRRKDFATADRIRDGLRELGVTLEDTAESVRWKKTGHQWPEGNGRSTT